ncbi:MAG: NAD-dependent deacylase [Myxococcales bacterium]|nr:NAD-dependent deacylase [Myxococcales bacterium]
MEEKITELARRIGQAKKIVVLSGAGLSAESGIPTFRGADGLWQKYNIFEIATPEAFERDPEMVWGFYNQRRTDALACEPNPAHYALRELEELVPDFLHITQNVDNLAQRVGMKNILELHGNLFATRCSQCDSPHPHLDGIVPFPTHCQRCGALVRPGVVWFGESVNKIGEAAHALRACQVFLVIGTSAQVQPAASLALLAKQQNAYVAEFNVEETDLSDTLDLLVLGPAGETLPRLIDRLKQHAR